MKRVLAAIPILPLLFSLSGCATGGPIYENYREIEQLRLVQTIGIDARGGGTVLSVSTGRGVGDGAQPILMAAPADGIAKAMAVLQDYSASEDLSYSHARYVLIGRNAAESGILSYLDFIERTQQLRPDAALLVVRDGEAEELVTGTGGESYDISTVLNSLARDAESRGETHLYSCLSVARKLARSGAALVCAVDRGRMSDVSSESEGGDMTALQAGFCVIKDGKAAGFITGNEAVAVGLLTGKTGNTPISLPDGAGGETTVTLLGSSQEISPVWENGRLSGFDVSLSVDASVTEPENPGTLLSTGSPEELEARLSDTLRRWAGNVLETERELCADFLGLGVTAELDEPELFDGMEESWPEALEGLEFHLTVSAGILHGRELMMPAEGKEG